MTESDFRAIIAIFFMLFVLGSCDQHHTLTVEIVEPKQSTEFNFKLPKRGQALPFTEPRK